MTLFFTDLAGRSFPLKNFTFCKILIHSSSRILKSTTLSDLSSLKYVVMADRQLRSKQGKDGKKEGNRKAMKTKETTSKTEIESGKTTVESNLKKKQKNIETIVPNVSTNQVKNTEEVEVLKTLKRKRKVTDKNEVPPQKESKTVSSSNEYADFEISKGFNFKISSWNVAGLRAWTSKGCHQYVTAENPDILCLQEIKCSEDQLPKEAYLAGYHPYFLCQSGGHNGVALYSKIKPIKVEYGLKNEILDNESRIITAEYEQFIVICVYVPNSGRKLVTLPKRLEWNQVFDAFVSKLSKKKSVIICGDMNVAHNEIDLANPKTNKRNAGFTQEERDGMTTLLSLGFIDSFRHLYPEVKNAYTFWTYMANARAKNVGWRLDYFLISEKFVPKIVDNVIRSKVLGSDHCPITLLLNI